MHRLLTGPLTIEHIQVPIADLPSALKGTRLTQLSDFHFDGLRLSEKLLAQAISASNAAQPDLVVLTGDFITDEPDAIYNLVPWLQKLESRCGIYAVLGNHDHRYRRSRFIVTRALDDTGIQVLWNQIAYPLGPNFALVGLADFWSSEFDPSLVMTQLEDTIPRIVLSHNPDSAASLQRWRIDLQLSGHTHGGQIALPGIGPLSLPLAKIYKRIPKSIKRLMPAMRSYFGTVKHWEWVQGLYSTANHPLYVNRGLGTYLPGRLFCPPEVTVITLV
ncbi:metallophosphoesterase [Leptothermofonsia sp. ETS-13]|uniref:metallophosphoesterase n=1 Tax=Leptothermofonsia sp. ETS-13 TaxID=3035696 RepID=UPI003BA3272C